VLLISILLIVIVTACIPLLIKPLGKLLPDLKMQQSYSWLPALAAVLFVTAFFIPDIHISKETTTFQQHFVGGGIYCTLLFIYFQRLLGWSTNWAVSILLLLAWTSAIGVANELLEFTLTKLFHTHIATSDTDWDLLANTLGALSSYIIILVGTPLFKKADK
jgi:hypothetical protein